MLLLLLQTLMATAFHGDGDDEMFFDFFDAALVYFGMVCMLHYYGFVSFFNKEK